VAQLIAAAARSPCGVFTIDDLALIVYMHYMFGPDVLGRLPSFAIVVHLHNMKEQSYG